MIQKAGRNSRAERPGGTDDYRGGGRQERGETVPEMLAFAYTAPITALVHDCDREPDKEPEILRQVEAFVKHFIGTYKRK